MADSAIAPRRVETTSGGFRGLELLSRGGAAEASRRLRTDAARVRPRDPAQASHLLSEAAFAQALAGDVRGCVGTTRQATAIGARSDDAWIAPARLALGWALVLAGDGRRGYRLYREWLPVAAQAREPSTLSAPALSGQVALWMEDYSVAETDLTAPAASGGGDPRVRLACHADLTFRTGDWPTARDSAAAGVRCAQPALPQLGLALCELARIEAVAGEAGKGRAHATQALAISAATGLGLLAIHATAVLGILELSAGAPRDALTYLIRTRALARRAGLREPNVVRWAPDLIEALVRTGQIAEGERTLKAFSVQANRTNRPWALAAAARHNGQFAACGDVDAAFSQAESALSSVSSPFDRGRLDLCWGERLLRDGRRLEARARLQRARARFQDLGAGPWAEQAERELRACGAPAARRPAEAHPRLTRQERRVALLAAEGLTNKEIAAALFVTAKTVEFHLGNVYRKLGVHSRTRMAMVVFAEPVIAGAAMRRLVVP